MSKKDLNYYLNLPYRISIEPIPPEEGGGWRAYIPELGELAFQGDGETPQEALANLEKIKADLFKFYLEKGIPIPEPALPVKKAA